MPRASATLISEGDGAEVQTGQDGRTLGVRVEVQNLTAAPLDLKPQDFSYVTCSGEGVRDTLHEVKRAELEAQAAHEASAAAERDGPTPWTKRCPWQTTACD